MKNLIMGKTIRIRTKGLLLARYSNEKGENYYGYYGGENLYYFSRRKLFLL
jgi:hypothetical protein